MELEGVGFGQTLQKNLCRAADLLQTFCRPSGQKGEVLAVFRKPVTNRNGEGGGGGVEGGGLGWSGG